MPASAESCAAAHQHLAMLGTPRFSRASDSRDAIRRRLRSHGTWRTAKCTNANWLQHRKWWCRRDTDPRLMPSKAQSRQTGGCHVSLAEDRHSGRQSQITSRRRFRARYLRTVPTAHRGSRLPRRRYIDAFRFRPWRFLQGATVHARAVGLLVARGEGWRSARFRARRYAKSWLDRLARPRSARRKTSWLGEHTRNEGFYFVFAFNQDAGINIPPFEGTVVVLVKRCYLVLEPATALPQRRRIAQMIAEHQHHW